jgi:hypothetical protein
MTMSTASTALVRRLNWLKPPPTAPLIWVKCSLAYMAFSSVFGRQTLLIFL